MKWDINGAVTRLAVRDLRVDELPSVDSSQVAEDSDSGDDVHSSSCSELSSSSESESSDENEEVNASRKRRKVAHVSYPLCCV